MSSACFNLGCKLGPYERGAERYVVQVMFYERRLHEPRASGANSVRALYEYTTQMCTPFNIPRTVTLKGHLSSRSERGSS